MTFGQEHRGIEAYNVGSYDIPPFGVCEYVDSLFPDKINKHARQVISVKRPTADSLTTVCVNGPTTIKAGGYGRVTMDYPAYALWSYTSVSDDQPEAGQSWGTEANKYTLKKGHSGFTIIGGKTNNGNIAAVRVEREIAKPKRVLTVRCQLSTLDSTERSVSLVGNNETGENSTEDLDDTFECDTSNDWVVVKKTGTYRVELTGSVQSFTQDNKCFLATIELERWDGSSWVDFSNEQASIRVGFSGNASGALLSCNFHILRYQEFLEDNRIRVRASALENSDYVVFTAQVQTARLIVTEHSNSVIITS